MNTKHQEKIKELAESFCATLRVECEHLYRSGLIDVDSYDPDYYPLAKVVITAAIHRMQDNFAPLHDTNLMSDVKNLINC